MNIPILNKDFILWTRDACEVIRTIDAPRYKENECRMCINCEHWRYEYEDVYGVCKCKGTLAPYKDMYTNYYETCCYCFIYKYN